MPLYEYHNPETGVKIEMARPVEDRNKPVELDGKLFVRSKFIPDTLLVFGTQLTPEQSFDQKILKGYYRMEEQHGSRFPSKYTKNQLAKVYNEARRLR